VNIEYPAIMIAMSFMGVCYWCH